MSFLRHREIFPSDGGARLAANAPAHRLDEFPAGYSLAGCAPAEPASASPAGFQYAVMSSCRSRTFHRTAYCVLTVCVSPGGKGKIISPAQLGAELERLKARRNAAEIQRSGSEATDESVPVQRIQKPVEDFCAEALQRFRSLSQNDLREFLRTIIRTIIFEGSQIRIQGHIPITDGGPETSARPTVAFMRSAGLRSLIESRIIQ
jgi:hypothetical protein